MRGRSLRFVDWFCGIGGIRLGMEQAGHVCVWSCEIDPFARAVYGVRFETEPEGKDINGVVSREIPHADIWCGGFPCQDVSVAGKRAGLDGGSRSGLIWKLLELVREKGQEGPRWLLLENVPGLLSLDQGLGFGRILAALEELGFRWAYRVLDARFFGVPQRRRRVFILAGRAGEEPDPATVLLEPEGLCGNPSTSGEERPCAPRSPAGGPGESGAAGFYHRAGSQNPCLMDDASPCLKTGGARETAGANGVLVQAFDWQKGGNEGQAEGEKGRSYIVRAGDYAGSLGASKHNAVIVEHVSDVAFSVRPQSNMAAWKGDGADNIVAVTDAAFALRASDSPNGHGHSWGLRGDGADNLVAHETGKGWWKEDDTAGPLRCEGENRPSRPSHAVVSRTQVRRLTPMECERLQGFPDFWTLIRRGKDKTIECPACYGVGVIADTNWRCSDPTCASCAAKTATCHGCFGAKVVPHECASDSYRYKVLGNSVAVPVIRWIGERLRA